MFLRIAYIDRESCHFNQSKCLSSWKVSLSLQIPHSSLQYTSKARLLNYTFPLPHQNEVYLKHDCIDVILYFVLNWTVCQSLIPAVGQTCTKVRSTFPFIVTTCKAFFLHFFSHYSPASWIVIILTSISLHVCRPKKSIAHLINNKRVHKFNSLLIFCCFILVVNKLHESTAHQLSSLP